jgi:hypothetical protein
MAYRAGVQITTEAEAELVHRGSAATLKTLRVIVTTNTRPADSSVTTRKNASDTSQVATITASTTGTYTDLTNTVSLTAGDTFAYKMVLGAGSGNFLAPSVTINQESAGQSATFWAGLAASAAATTNANSTRYWFIAGPGAAPSTTEPIPQRYCPVGGAISNLRAYVSAARATNTTLKSRLNGADGAMSVTLTASTTGAFEDTTNSDTISEGDLFAVATVTGAGADTLTITNLSVLYTPSVSNAAALSSSSTSVNLTAATAYFAPIGALTALSENLTQVAAPMAGSASYLFGRVSSNTSTTTVTMVLRNNGADTAVTYTIAGGATGVFVDTSNSVAIAAGDLLSIQGSGADATVQFRQMGLRYTADPGGTGNFFMFFG